MAARVDMAGKTVGRLFVEEYAYTAKNIAYWVCRCICGTLVTVSGRAMRSGNSQSCGCRQRMIASNWMTKLHRRQDEARKKHNGRAEPKPIGFREVGLKIRQAMIKAGALIEAQPRQKGK